jgi:hypothetical protein
MSRSAKERENEGKNGMRGMISLAEKSQSL